MDCLDKGKTFCLKQVNSDDDENYFGVPWEYDENWYGCYLCGRGLGRKYAFEPQVGMPEGIKPKLKRRVLCTV